MSRPGIRRSCEELGDYFEEAGLLGNLTKILNYTDDILMIVKWYGGGLHPVLLRTLVLENLERIEDFAKAYAQYVGASTMRALCGELKDLLEGGDVNG